MVLSPRDALVLTPENVAQADDLCRKIDAWLRRNLTTADTKNHIPIEPPYPPRKVLEEVARRYREAGWIGAWYERSGRGAVFVIWTTINHRQHEGPLAQSEGIRSSPALSATPAPDQ